MRPAVLSALSALVLAACTTLGGPDDAGSVSAAARAGSVAVVQIERSALEDPDVAGSGGVVSALFARYRGVPGQTVLDLFGLGATTPLETCELRASDAFALADPSATVELIDAGEIEVRVAGTRTSLAAQTFPDLGGVVSGAFYAEDVALGAARADVDEHIVTSRGGEIAGFEAVAIAPAAPAEVWIDGIDAGAGARMARPGSVDVAWAAGDPRDRVDIELTALGEVLRCTARDDGAFTLDPELLASLPEDAAARLVVRRVRVTPFDAPGIDTAWIWISTSRGYRVELK